MDNVFVMQLNMTKKDDDKKIILPKNDSAPVSSTEKLVREEVRKLSENAEEIKKLREQIEHSKKKIEENN